MYSEAPSKCPGTEICKAIQGETPQSPTRDGSSIRKEARTLAYASTRTPKGRCYRQEKQTSQKPSPKRNEPGNILMKLTLNLNEAKESPQLALSSMRSSDDGFDRILPRSITTLRSSAMELAVSSLHLLVSLTHAVMAITTSGVHLHSFAGKAQRHTKHCQS